MAWVASQLSRPHGLAAPLYAVMLNRSNRKAIAMAVETLALGPGSVAADLGFGGGVGLRLLLDGVAPGGRVYGIDISPDMVGRASRRFRGQARAGRLVLLQGSIIQLPLDDGVLDGAITVNTLYFIAELDRVFRELRRVLKPAGVVAVGVGDPQEMARAPFTAYEFRLRPVDEIVAVALAAGLGLRDRRRAGLGDRGAHILAFSPSAGPEKPR